MTAFLADESVPILTAIADPSLEAELAAGFSAAGLGVTVVRRCVDVPELLSVATAGTARAALISADLRGLDRQCVSLLTSNGVATVGLAADEGAERRLHQLGFTLVVAASGALEQVAGALRAAVDDGYAPGDTGLPERGSQVERGDLRAWRDDPARQEQPFDPLRDPQLGGLLAVWGPAGGPGRTTLALGLADAFARAGRSALLADVDPYGGAVATLTGVLDEAPGVAAACRAANAGLLDVARLADCCTELTPTLRLLTGIAEPARWPELHASSLDLVLSLARLMADVVIADCGFCLEEDEDASGFDSLAQRNAATLSALRAATRVVAVGSGDPLGLSRLVRDLPRLASILGASLADLSASGRLVVVVNRVRSGLLPGDPVRAVTDAVQRHTGIAPLATLPLEVACADAAHGRGKLLSEATAGGALAKALAAVAAQLEGAPAAAAGTGRRWRRSRRDTRSRRPANPSTPAAAGSQPGAAKHRPDTRPSSGNTH